MNHRISTSMICVMSLAFSFISATAQAQSHNVVLVTLDGLRWQELFGGADRRLISEDAGGVPRPAEALRIFDRESATERRELLMPFFWSTIAKQGQVFGSPDEGSLVRVTNEQHFSYPGYNELLCGFADPRVDSNDKRYNENVTVLEWLNRQDAFRGRVAAFTSWDVFPYIINQPRSGVYVNAGWQPLDYAGDASTLGLLNAVARELPHYWDGVRYDTFTFHGAMEYVREKQPRVLYLSLGETDDWAHAGRYDLYLESAQQSDEFVRRLWELLQSLDAYRGTTTLLMTTDHGRGDGRESWKSHSTSIPGCDRIWIAALGPGVSALGPRSNVDATQAQVAATVAALLGLDFGAHDERIARPLSFDAE